MSAPSFSKNTSNKIGNGIEVSGRNTLKMAGIHRTKKGKETESGEIKKIKLIFSFYFIFFQGKAI
jgi:hypothetical protein